MTANNFCGNDKENMEDSIEPKGKAYDSMQKNGPANEAQGENKGETTDNMEQNVDMSQIIEAKEKEIDNYKNKWLRTQADLENYRKRVERDIQEIHLYAGEKLVKDILPILDNFERALASIEDKESDLYRGVEMIYEEFKRMLEKHGVKEIEALGKPFDPYYHEAIMTVESDEHEPGIVVEVVRKGYIYNSKVIRPSMVKVSKNN